MNDEWTMSQRVDKKFSFRKFFINTLTHRSLIVHKNIFIKIFLLLMMLAMMTSTWLTTLSTPTQPNLSMVYRCCIDVVLNIRGSVSEITGGKKCDFPAEKRIFLPPFISSSIANLYYYLCLFFFYIEMIS